MSAAIRIQRHGGPDVLQVADVPTGEPKTGEVVVRQRAIGVNFIDIYARTGLYPSELPSVLGQEAAGIITAVGDGVTEFGIGNRVAYAGVGGAYSTERVIDADRLIMLPDTIDDETAASVMLKGLTAECLLRRAFRVKPGHVVLFHAAAGGVGQIACQWAKALGATVIGTVGSDEKLETARTLGCDHAINYDADDFVQRVAEITDGRGVDVVYDSVGEATFPGSLDALKPRGMWVTFGQSSGKVPDFSPLMLAARGSVFMTRPRLLDYIADRDELKSAASALFAVIASGDVVISTPTRFPLIEAAKAHRALEGRRTTGSLVLLP